MIELINVSKRFKKNIIFDSINLTIDCSKFKIKGSNGIGKSVLLKLIVGFSKPDEGSILIDGNPLGSTSDFIENAGISINAPEFMKNYTGYENLVYLAKAKGLTDTTKMNELIHVFGLDEDINKKYKTYSLGMKQKMRLIQALMDTPQYLILDEPFDALDKESKQVLKDYLNTYLLEDVSRQLVFTSHEESDDLFADHIVEINNHKLITIK